MGRLPARFVLVCAAVLVLSVSADALAWGPATHVQLASDLLSNLWLLPTGLAALIARNRRFFVYGCVATDTVFAKKLSKIKQVCHHWATGFGMLDAARTEGGRAFAYGYLAHLAADTVAHNKFLPRQTAVSRSTVSFGHLYWEFRADADIAQPHWQELRAALRGTYPEPERLLEESLRETLLSFRANRIFFKRMNLLCCERGWRRSVQFWSRLSRFNLDARVLGAYRTESLDRLVDVLSRGRSSAVLYEDPNGNAALGHAKARRRQLRQMKRARIPHAHIIEEAAAGLAPSLSNGRPLRRVI
ncbi:MAG TPA: zinc dependent phospholipase C family protein [Phycisphaerae bacterium]|nr:zinc dependent phospholipase C family protein [Phycisphaerae bacterium]